MHNRIIAKYMIAKHELETSCSYLLTVCLHVEGFPVTAGGGGYDERTLLKIKINDPNLAKKIVLYRKKKKLCLLDLLN